MSRGFPSSVSDCFHFNLTALWGKFSYLSRLKAEGAALSFVLGSLEVWLLPPAPSPARSPTENTERGRCNLFIPEKGKEGGQGK